MAKNEYRLCGELRTQIGAEFSELSDEGGGFMIEHYEELRNDLSSVRHARKRVDEILQTDDTDLRDSALLLVSEVVTNALIHTNGDVSLVIKARPSWIRVEVGDDSTRAPKVKNPHVDSVSGRGLELVDALSNNWGVNSHRSGKTVWFEIESLTSELEREAFKETSSVVLRNAPAKLVCETIAHSDQALRELLVHSSRSNADVEAYADAAEIELGELADQARQALELGIENPDLVIELPLEAGETALEMLNRLERADKQAKDGDLLSPVPPKRVQACRHWLFTEIAEQLMANVPSQRESQSSQVSVNT